MTDRQHPSLTTWFLHVAGLPPRASSQPLAEFVSTHKCLEYLKPFLPSALPASGMLQPQASSRPQFKMSCALRSCLGQQGLLGTAACAPACSWHLSQQWTPISCCGFSFCTGSLAEQGMGLRLTRCWSLAWCPAGWNGWMSSASTGVYSSAWCSHIHVGSQLCSLGHVT